MKIKQLIEKVPGGWMVLPLMLGAILNTLDQAQVPWMVEGLKGLGAQEQSGKVSFLRIGGFCEPLFKSGALTLIGLFLVCVGAQMNPRVGGRALKKGLLIMASKWLLGVLAAWVFGKFCDPFDGWLGLSAVALMAAISNDNGGLYVALAKLYGNRSDVGAIAVISINDGPFLTLLGLGLLGAQFPFLTFASVLIPVLLGMVLGNLDREVRDFLAPGENILIPFFAFALGANMSFEVFLNLEVLAGGLVLGLLTILLTLLGCSLVFRLAGERSLIAPAAECSTAGNAVLTPPAVALAAGSAGLAGLMNASEVAAYQAVASRATCQVSISVLLTAILCPLVVYGVDKVQGRRGIEGRLEDP